MSKVVNQRRVKVVKKSNNPIGANKNKKGSNNYKKNSNNVKNKTKSTKKTKVKTKNVTVLEALAVILIIVVAIAFFSPITEKIKDSYKKREYINNVNTYVDTAVDMYSNKEYKDKFVKVGNSYIIKFSSIDSVDINKDPYGFAYQDEESYISFDEKGKEIIVNVKSCTNVDDLEYCYEIANVNAKDLSTKSIKTSIN